MAAKWLFLCTVAVSHVAESFLFAFPNRKPLRRNFAIGAETKIDFQTDSSLYGRGEFHLSASLDEDDIVVYQTGTWLVDGVEVGDGSPTVFRYAQVENLQIVWTHNCEHGVIRGLQAEVTQTPDGNPFVALTDPIQDVEFGPEQLVARVPVDWDHQSCSGVALVNFDESTWSDSIIST